MRNHQTRMFVRTAAPRARAASLVAAIAVASVVGACQDFLTARNPNAIEEGRLADTAMIDLMVNGVIGEFQGGSGSGYAWLAYYSAIYTDELRNHHVFFEEGLFDQRRVNPDNGTYSFFLYTPLQRTRWLADSVAGRIRTLKGDDANSDIRLARTYAYAGHSLILLGELLCASPVAVGEKFGVPLPSDEVLAQAVNRFDQAIAVARAARAVAAARPSSSFVCVRSHSVTSSSGSGSTRTGSRRDRIVGSSPSGSPVVRMSVVSSGGSSSSLSSALAASWLASWVTSRSASPSRKTFLRPMAGFLAAICRSVSIWSR